MLSLSEEARGATGYSTEAWLQGSNRGEELMRGARQRAEALEHSALGYRPPAPAACSPVVPKQISQPIAVM